MWGWIVLGVLVLIVALLLAIRVTFIISYDQSWSTKIRILFIEKEINLTELIRGILFPNQVVEEKIEEKKKQKEPEPAKETAPAKDPLASIKAIYAKDGVAGVIEFIQTLVETLGKAGGVLFRHFVIHELHVKMVVAGSDAAETAKTYGRVCGQYYPFIGVIRNGMKVRRYSEEIYADFLAPKGEQAFYFKGSINVKNLLGIVLTAVKTFLVNLIKSKKTGNPVKKAAPAKQTVQ